MVFRGDNTVPVFEKKFAPLHNRCLLLLSKLVLDPASGGSATKRKLVSSRIL